jgi:hypothetical protein
MCQKKKCVKKPGPLIEYIKCRPLRLTERLLIALLGVLITTPAHLL